MKKITRTLVTAVLSVLFLLAAVCCISETVMGQGRYSREQEARYLSEMERLYIKEMKDFLGEKGYNNSGITMTRITTANGTHSYTVTIHHDKIGKLTDGEKESLLEECRRLPFRDEEGRVFYRFLEA